MKQAPFYTGTKNLNHSASDKHANSREHQRIMKAIDNIFTLNMSRYRRCLLMQYLPVLVQMMKNPPLSGELFDHHWACGPFHSCRVAQQFHVCHKSIDEIFVIKRKMIGITGGCISFTVYACAHLHINLLKKESKLARHVQILRRRNWVMAMMNWTGRKERRKYCHLDLQ